MFSILRLLDWALPDQLVFSTVSALLHISSQHHKYGNESTASIVFFVTQIVDRIHHSTCKLTFSV